MALLGPSERFPWATQALCVLALSLSSLSFVACQGSPQKSEASKSTSKDSQTSEEKDTTSEEEEESDDQGKGKSDNEDGPEENPNPDEDDENEDDSKGSEEPDDKEDGETSETSGSNDEESSSTEDDPNDKEDKSSDESTTTDEGTTGEGSDETSTPDSSTSDDTSSEEPKEEPAPADEIQLFMSVDWEGVELEEGNIRDFERFRRRFPEVPITQYLNAAYYTKPRARPSVINRQVRRTLLNIDELGLHIHGWKMLFEASGVRYRSSPVFFGKVFVDNVGDAGHNIDIGAYTTAELRKVIAHSINILEKNGYGRAKSFRSGGWMSRRSVLEALTAEGILRDASDVATRHFIDDSWFNTPLYRWLSRELWPNTTFTSQPYYMKTEHGPLLQIPDNGALADYVTGEEMLQVYKACLAYKRKNPDKHVTMSFGFHTESATRYLPRVTRGLELIYAQAKKDKIKVVARTSEQLKVSAK